MVFKSSLIIELLIFINRNLIFCFLVLLFFLIKFNFYFFRKLNNIFLLLIIFWFLIFYLKPLINSKKLTLLTNFNFLICLIFFLTKNFFIFYVIFEFSIIPILFIIIFWGYQIERIQARSFLLGYTLFFSIPSIFIFFLIQINFFNIELFLFLKLNKIFLIIIFSIFLVKLPMFFFHIWLPKAHVEAPTVGSIFLAAILLKLGVFGILKIIIIFKNKNLIEFLFLFCFLGSLFSCLLCVLQTDIKSLIAYSSVVHINFLFIGILSKYCFITSSIFIIILFHALVRRIIFFKAGYIFNIFKTRKIYFSSINSSPNKILIILIIFIFILNFNPPPSLGILPEIFLIINFFNKNKFLFLLIILFGLWRAFFCIYLILNILNGKNIFFKNFSIGINNIFLNLIRCLLSFNFIFLILFF